MDSLADLPAGSFVDFVWWFLTRDAEPNEVEKFKAKLWRPPKGEIPPPESPWSAENEMRNFRALQAALSAG